jgi:hypothetical protein
VTREGASPKQSSVGWAYRGGDGHLARPRQTGSPAFRGMSHRESSTGRDAGAHDLVAAGVPARHFLDPGSESEVTKDRQDAGPTIAYERSALISQP